ncbi:MAG: formate dehydrogenase accessory protein FdhE [Thiobacillaceae bacterium]
MPTPILEPGQIEAAAGDIPELRLAPADLFTSRARRLRQLAEGHTLCDYLRFVAELAEAQQSELDRHPEIPLPDAELLSVCRDHEMPPLSPAGWNRHPHWQEVARRLADVLYDAAPLAGRESLSQLLAQKREWLESQAGCLLSSRFDDLDLATAPIIGAALQVQWTHLARKLEPYEVARPEHPNLCPVCGSHPVASVVRIGGAENGLRYLHCALCGTEWHVVRSRCSNCDSSRDIAYFNVQGGKEFVRAEACPECRTYLKIIHQDKDPHVDPVADDLASMALDLLMGDEDYAKSGISYLMIYGNSEA